MRPYVPAVVFLLIVVLASIAIISQNPLTDTPTATLTPVATGIPLLHTYDRSPSAFGFQYPNGWLPVVPQQGLLMVAKIETLNEGVPGPTLTVQRSIRLAQNDTLDDVMETYLRQGPLLPDQAWTVVSDVIVTDFNGRAARTANLEGANSPDELQLHIHVITTRADNGLVYVLVASAPLDQWDEYQSTLSSILASIEIFE